MLLKEYTASWPPTIMVGDTAQETIIPHQADLADVVLYVRNQSPGKLLLRLRRSTYREYPLMLPVPASQQQKIMFDILRKESTTLLEVGELPIS